MNSIKQKESECGKFTYFSNGRVFSNTYNKFIGHDGGKGYLYIDMFKNGKHSSKSIHRLIFEAFNGEIPKNMTINHIDGNKSNNDISNLECVTRSENTKHSFKVLGNNSGSKKRTVKDECVILSIMSMGRSMTIREISKHFNIREDIIGAIKKGLYDEFKPVFYDTNEYIAMTERFINKANSTETRSEYFKNANGLFNLLWK